MSWLAEADLSMMDEPVEAGSRVRPPSSPVLGLSCGPAVARQQSREPVLLNAAQPVHSY